MLKSEVDIAYSRAEALMNDALVTALQVPADLFRVHGVAEFVPRRGFMKREPGILDVMDTTRSPGPARRMDYSGTPAGWGDAARPVGSPW